LLLIIIIIICSFVRCCASFVVLSKQVKMRWDYQTCIYNARTFSSGTESEALAVTRWAAW